MYGRSLLDYRAKYMIDKEFSYSSSRGNHNKGLLLHYDIFLPSESEQHEVLLFGSILEGIFQAHL